MSDTQQRAADLATAGRTGVARYGVHDDTCERAWAQGAATDTAYRAIRHDGIAPSTGPAEEARFLAMCRSQSEDEQQCWDRDYRRAHADTCGELATTRGDAAHLQMQQMTRAGQAAADEQHGSE